MLKYKDDEKNRHQAFFVWRNLDVQHLITIIMILMIVMIMYEIKLRVKITSGI